MLWGEYNEMQLSKAKNNIALRKINIVKHSIMSYDKQNT